MLAGAQPEPARRESWSVSKALSRSFRGGSFSRGSFCAGSFRAGSFRIGSFRVRRPPGPSVDEARRASYAWMHLPKTLTPNAIPQQWLVDAAADALALSS